MKTRTSTITKTRKMAMLAMLTAIIVVLQIVCTFIKFGPFSITLALTPIIVGAAIYGGGAGAFLGFIFGAVVYITGLMGYDGGFINMMMEYNAVATTLICFVKGIAAGAVAGLVYKLIAKASKTAAAVVSGIVAPVVNTGLFAIASLTIFYGFASGFTTEGQSPVGLVLFTWIGANFIVEFISNVALGAVITRVVEYYNKKFG